VQVTGAADQLRFLEHVGVHGPRSAGMDALSLRLRAERDATEMDTVPDDVWERVRDALADERSAHPEPAAVADGPRREPSTAERPPRGGPLAAVAGILGDADLDVLATNDVRWDSVASVEPLGEEPVFDATVLGTHNFVVEGLAAHNSLEQDADMVILLHREDVYERESTRPGEADLIVAKHRNGPTRDLTVAFQGHYSRFVDMAHG
jgi:replicative DNA helicase